MQDDIKDASQMTDEELDQAIESGSPSEESTEPESTKEEEQVDEQEEEQVEEVDEGEEAPTEEPPKEPSRRENLRIRQVINKLKQSQEPAPAPRAQGMDYRQALDADDEIYQQLEQDRQAQAESAYRAGVEQANSIQFHTRLELDAPKVESKYPQLNPNSPDFNPVVNDALAEQYIYMVGYNPQTGTARNPNLRWSEFVDATMELVEQASTQKVQTSRKNIAKQAATTGLRPDGSASKKLNLNKAPEQMSDEELNAALAQGGLLPKKR